MQRYRMDERQKTVLVLVKRLRPRSNVADEYVLGRTILLCIDKTIEAEFASLALLRTAQSQHS